MRKVRTVSQLQSALDEELVWRRKEISDFKGLIAKSNDAQKKVLLRAAVPLLYAHWEGYIKQVAILYTELLGRMGLRYEEILECFQGVAAISHVRTLGDIRKRVFASSELLMAIHGIPSQQVRIPLADYIGRIGNLNYELFSQITRFIGIDLSEFDTRRLLIDERLLKNRNDIAHGEFVAVDETGFDDMSKEIFEIMGRVNTEIQNAAALQTYRRP